MNLQSRIERLEKVAAYKVTNCQHTDITIPFALGGGDRACDSIQCRACGKTLTFAEMSDAALEVIVKTAPYDVTRLTDAELIDLESCLSKSPHAPLTPELNAVMERVKR